MKRFTWISLIALLAFFGSCAVNLQSDFTVSSPDGKLNLAFFLAEGQPAYAVSYGRELVLDTSRMSFDFEGAASFGDGSVLVEIMEVDRSSHDETYELPWGEVREVRDHHNEMSIKLTEVSGENPRSLVVRFRLFDDGLGFRYEFPSGWGDVVIADENTQFNLTGDHTAWWIPGDWDIYEHLYTESSFSAIDASSKRGHPALAQTFIPFNAVNTPVTMRTASGLHLSFHEAALTDYSGMTLRVNGDRLLMESELVGSGVDRSQEAASDRATKGAARERNPEYAAKVRRTAPFNTPWRTVQVSPDAASLLDSRLILNLNEPNKLGSVDWFNPMKYVGIWWEMHLNKSSWDVAAGKHGATTANAKAHIDFAAANGIGGVLVEGWNTGWEHWIGFDDREGVFDFITPYDDYDLNAVAAYARSKGVEIIMHHETSSAPRTYAQQMDTAYRLMQQHGMHAVKTGYVGPLIPKGEYHHGQWMVQHYRSALETAAKYQVAINAHEPIKDTGIRRTLPNAISREGLRGQEFNAWSPDGGNRPDHLPTVAFTRMLAGPIDFTPGVFDITLDEWKPDNQINTTLAQQLALYVVIYSPVQMACDLLENYRDQPAFQFIRDVAVDWEETRVLEGEVGDYVVIARRERGGERWFLGAITDESARTLTIPLDFLSEGVSYETISYIDGPAADYKSNPRDMEIIESTQTYGDMIELKLATGGGAAISFVPVAK